MQQFLDACWLYGDKECISKIYMCPIVMSTTYGEREGKLTLATAWEILGGLPCSGICGYIPEISMLECGAEYDRIIEKKAESLYRTVSQKVASFPTSNQVVKQKVSCTQNVNLTPQESEQLSFYASDEDYIQRQKEDIKELTSFFKDMMESRVTEANDNFISELESHFVPQPGVQGIYRVLLKNGKKPLIIRIQNHKCECFYGTSEFADVEIQMDEAVLKTIIAGKTSFQRAFMGGDMTMKGDFKTMRALDQVLVFGQSDNTEEGK